jgi:hypothetical protein
LRWESLSRTYQIFVRSYWASAADSLSPAASSLQGGAGIRLRPLRSINAFLGVERLFPLGSTAFAGWLARATYGLSSLDRAGRSAPRIRPFYSVYGDAAYLKAGPSSWLYQAEGGAGITIRTAGFDFSPYYLVSARYQDRLADRRAYALHGPAISFRRRMECSTTCAFSAIEFFVSWRTGQARVPSGDLVTNPSGWAFGTILGR